MISKLHGRFLIVVSALFVALLQQGTELAYAQTPIVRFFQIPANIIAGESIRVQWEVENLSPNDNLSLFLVANDGYPGFDLIESSLPSSGWRMIETENTAITDPSSYTVILATQPVLNDPETIRLNDGTVDVFCRYLWFMLTPYDTLFPDRSDAPIVGCPDRPVVSRASQQQFENGFMLWIEALDEIWAVADDGRIWRFNDTYETNADPVSDPSIKPPSGRLQPEYGFGKVWRDQWPVRQTLGWATEHPVNFETVNQTTTYFRAPEHLSWWRLADGSLFQIEPFDAERGSIRTDYDGYANPHDGFRPELDDTPASSRTPNSRPPTSPQPPTSGTPCPASGAWPPGCNPNLDPSPQPQPPAGGGVPCPSVGVWPPGCNPNSSPTPTPPPAGECVIPSSGPWPPCATAGDRPPANTPDDCIIPPSGPWPACARG